MNWDTSARNILKAEIVRRGMTYERLAKCLRDMNVEETSSSIANKLSRGTFSFVFFLQCMRALGVENVVVEIPAPTVVRRSGAG